jgi:transcriptional regulator with XRE-family HTH domain
MPQPLDHRTYRSVAELIKALRWRHLLTQQQLAERTGVAQAQLSRYEKGTAEPSLATLRRLLEPLGWAPTLGLEPSTAALDECFRAGHTAAELLGPDVVSVAVLAAQAAADGADIVVGGDAAAVLQGVPLKPST